MTCLRLKQLYQDLCKELELYLVSGVDPHLILHHSLQQPCHTLRAIRLDEATNSLDALTEKNIIEYLLKNYKNTTLIMIAHRLSVLKRCNEILLFDKGKIVDAGTYDFLFENNQVFKLMAEKN